MNLMVSSGANSSWPDKKRGVAFWVGNDNLCDVYAVVFDGRERGVVEDDGRSVGSYPDLDTPLDTRLFAAVVKGLRS
jgi:hypothetical protein